MRDLTLWLMVNNPVATPHSLGAKAEKSFASLPPSPQPFINKWEQKLTGCMNELLKNDLQVRTGK